MLSSLLGRNPSNLNVEVFDMEDRGLNSLQVTECAFSAHLPPLNALGWFVA